MTPGWKTSEFWVTLLMPPIMAALAKGLHAMLATAEEGSALWVALSALSGALASIGYSSSRARVKEAMARAAGAAILFLSVFSCAVTFAGQEHQPLTVAVISANVDCPCGPACQCDPCLCTGPRALLASRSMFRQRSNQAYECKDGVCRPIGGRDSRGAFPVNPFAGESGDGASSDEQFIIPDQFTPDQVTPDANVTPATERRRERGRFGHRLRERLRSHAGPVRRMCRVIRR